MVEYYEVPKDKFYDNYLRGFSAGRIADRKFYPKSGRGVSIIRYDVDTWKIINEITAMQIHDKGIDWLRDMMAEDVKRGKVKWFTRPSPFIADVEMFEQEIENIKYYIKRTGDANLYKKKASTNSDLSWGKFIASINGEELVGFQRKIMNVNKVYSGEVHFSQSSSMEEIAEVCSNVTEKRYAIRQKYKRWKLDHDKLRFLILPPGTFGGTSLGAIRYDRIAGLPGVREWIYEWDTALARGITPKLPTDPSLSIGDYFITSDRVVLRCIGLEYELTNLGTIGKKITSPLGEVKINPRGMLGSYDGDDYHCFSLMRGKKERYGRFGMTFLMWGDSALKCLLNNHGNRHDAMLQLREIMKKYYVGEENKRKLEVHERMAKQLVSSQELAYMEQRELTKLLNKEELDANKALDILKDAITLATKQKDAKTLLAISKNLQELNRMTPSLIQIEEKTMIEIDDYDIVDDVISEERKEISMDTADERTDEVLLKDPSPNTHSRSERHNYTEGNYEKSRY